LKSLCRSRIEKRQNWCQRLRGSGKSKPTVIQMRWRLARNRKHDASNQAVAIAGLAPALPGNRWKSAKEALEAGALVLAPSRTLLLHFGALTSPTKSTRQALGAVLADLGRRGDATTGLLSVKSDRLPRRKECPVFAQTCRSSRSLKGRKPPQSCRLHVHVD
jgi:hypothetical protein